MPATSATSLRSGGWAVHEAIVCLLMQKHYTPALLKGAVSTRPQELAPFERRGWWAESAERELQKLASQRQRHGLGPAVSARLLQDVPNMVPNGVNTDAQPRRDDRVRQTVGHQPKDLELPRREGDLELRRRAGITGGVQRSSSLVNWWCVRLTER